MSWKCDSCKLYETCRTVFLELRCPLDAAMPRRSRRMVRERYETRWNLRTLLIEGLIGKNRK